MRIEQALKLRDDVKHRLHDIYATAAHFGLTSQAMETNRNNMLRNSGADKAPHWVRSYLDGYWACLIENAYRYDLMYGGKDSNDTFYSTHSSRSDYYEKQGLEAKDFADNGTIKEKGHYWVRTGKPFYIGSMGE